MTADGSAGAIGPGARDGVITNGAAGAGRRTGAATSAPAGKGLIWNGAFGWPWRHSRLDPSRTRAYLARSFSRPGKACADPVARWTGALKRFAERPPERPKGFS